MDLTPWRLIGEGIGSETARAEAARQVAGETPLGQPGLVVVAGDWHGNTRWVEHVLRRAAAAGATTVLQLGDFGLWPKGTAYLDRISALCTELGLTVLWLDGNHEDFDQLERYPVLGGLRPVRPRVWHLPRGTRWTWAGRTWLAVGGATSLDRAVRETGKSWWPQERLTDDEVEAVVFAGATDVLLTHDCPTMVEHHFGTPPSFWALEDLALADVHRERVQRLVDGVTPKLLLHGHLHRAYERHMETPWGELVVTGLDCDGSQGHALVVDPSAPEKGELLDLA